MTLLSQFVDGFIYLWHNCSSYFYWFNYYSFQDSGLAFQDGHFLERLTYRGRPKRPPIPKICQTYLKMVKSGTVTPYLKKIQKLYDSRDTPMSSANISIFSPEISKFYYIKKYRYRLHFDTYFLIILTFLEYLKIVLINLVTTLMTSAKMATRDLLRTKVFWNEGYDVVTYVHDFTSRFLSGDSSYIVLRFGH